ncbi:X-box-binding protein 1-like [Stegodyphus dumicola]|uniref:X-box-binding protein 1-like n=1 Tax=Stegodyphus dumicola TaxID=202533 RepID=UPI0015A9B131|nr:X-box-binding protein 1-like [Stegodyphus dumicola]
MKNRVAAQTARDRKKARMAELEEQVSELQTEKKVLLLTNIELRNKNAILEKENAELKLRLGIQNADETLKEAKKEKDEASDCAHPRVSDCKSLEYASLINEPLQKGQDMQILTLWMMQYVYLPAVARLMLFLIYYSSVAKILCSMRIPAATCVKMEKTERTSQIQKWWGPHQKAWNPTKN